MEVMWRTDTLNEVGCELRLLDLDGDKVFEVAVPIKESFTKRLKDCCRYLFGRSEFRSNIVLTDDLFYDMCRRVASGREDS